MEKRFETILTHSKPHLDEITAIWILRKFGEKKFPGISSAKITFQNNGNVPKEQENLIAIGIGGGRFDEHSTNGGLKKDECATTLVARDLNLMKNPVLEKIIKFVLNNDIRITGQPFDLGYLIKLLHQQYPNDPEGVMEWAIIGLETKYYEQLQFWTTTKEEFKRAQVEMVQGPGKKLFRMVIIASDNEQINKFARSIHGGRSAIIIQKKSSGNVMIFTNKQSELPPLYDVVQMIRLAEQEASGKRITNQWKELSCGGKIEGLEEWYFHEEGQMILNGSFTAQVSPTKIPLNEIKKLVKIGINSDLFETNHYKKCKEGVCTSSRINPCSWYYWGLNRCQSIRHQQYNNNKK